MIKYFLRLINRKKIKKLNKKINLYIVDKEFKPSYKYLCSIGFQEIGYCLPHPYNVCCEFMLGSGFKLSMNAFHEFSFWFETKAYQELYFVNDSDLLTFLKAFNPTKSQASKN
jgi:hypothetical protein